jgi:hypothetical protein
MGRALLAGLALAGLAFVACGNGNNRAPAVVVSSPAPTATPIPPTNTAIVAPSPTATSAPDCQARLESAQVLVADVEGAMAGYPGTWGFAFIDVLCGATVSTDPGYHQYAASSGKIISIIAVLRAVEAGDIAFEAVEESLVTILHVSDDLQSDYIETFVTADDLNAVIADAGVVDSTIRGAWRFTNFSAVDLARVWAALVDGRLLSREWTEWVLARAGEADIPPPYETFPGGSFEHEYLQYGQKAGYYVSDGVPYFLVGAGFLRDTVTGQGFVSVVLMVTEFADLLEPQRRTVFPLVVEHVEGVLGTTAGE